MNLNSGYWPLLLVLLGPISGLLGVLLGGYMSSRYDKERWRRERRVAFDELRLQAYAEVLTLIDSIAVGSIFRRHDDLALDEYQELTRKVTGVATKAEFLASSPVREVLGELIRVMAEVLEPGLAKAEREKRVLAIRPAHRRFADAVRRELMLV